MDIMGIKVGMSAGRVAIAMDGNAGMGIVIGMVDEEPDSRTQRRTGRRSRASVAERGGRAFVLRSLDDDQYTVARLRTAARADRASAGTCIFACTDPVTAAR